MTALSAAAGLLLILFVLAEAFEALVLPRRVTRPFRFTRLYYRHGWRAWVALAHLLPGTRRRQTFLSVFGIGSLGAVLAGWLLAHDASATLFVVLSACIAASGTFALGVRRRSAS